MKSFVPWREDTKMNVYAESKKVSALLKLSFQFTLTLAALYYALLLVMIAFILNFEIMWLVGVSNWPVAPPAVSSGNYLNENKHSLLAYMLASPWRHEEHTLSTNFGDLDPAIGDFFKC